MDVSLLTHGTDEPRQMMRALCSPGSKSSRGFTEQCPLYWCACADI